jgi:hypothetical protein
MQTTYRHLNTDGTYRVLSEKARIETEGMDGEHQVIYQSLKDGQIWVRPKAEFFDGRFERIWSETLR